MCAVTRSFTPADLISNSGLGGGKMAHILAPLIAGIVSSITHSGVMGQIVNFATIRVGKTIEENSDSIARHGERCAMPLTTCHGQCATVFCWCNGDRAVLVFADFRVL